MALGLGVAQAAESIPKILGGRNALIDHGGSIPSVVDRKEGCRVQIRKLEYNMNNILVKCNGYWWIEAPRSSLPYGGYFDRRGKQFATPVSQERAAFIKLHYEREYPVTFHPTSAS